jgi:PAS domain S-box-containing protein
MAVSVDAESGPSDRLHSWLRTCNAITDALASARGLSDAAPDLLRGLAGGFGADLAILWTPEATQARLEKRTAWGREGTSSAAFEAECDRAPIEKGSDVPGRAWALRWPVSVPDLSADRSSPRAAAAGSDGLKGSLAVPLLYGEWVYGVVELLFRGPLKADEAMVLAAGQVGKQVGQFVAREEALRTQARTKRELSDLFENAPVGLHVTDRDGRILRVNRAELEMLGYSRDELLGRLWRDLHVDPVECDRVMARLAEGEEVRAFDSRWRCRDGTVKWIRTSANAALQDAEVVGVRAFSRDVTTAKAAEIALQESEQRHRRLVEGAREYALHTLDAQGRITSWSSAGTRLFGYEAADLIGRDYAVLFVPEDRTEGVPQRLLRLAIDEGEFNFQGWRLRKDGSRFWADLVITSFLDVSGEPSEIAILVRDLTERRRLEALRAKSADLEQANREVLDAARRNAEVVRAVAAAIEEPAAAIEAAAGRLHRTGRSDPQALSDLTAATDRLRRAIRGIDDRATVVTPPSRPEPADLLRIAVETREMLRDAAAARRVRVETEVDPSLTDVVAEPTSLRQVFYNFLSNGIKFSRERGRVVVRVLPEGEERFRVETEDSGIGMSEREIAEAMRPGGGSDAEGAESRGLAATRQIVEAQGGRIGVHSTPGRGSVFFAVLPRAPRVVEPREAGAAAGTAQRRVLVVAEDSTTRAHLSWTLGNAGHDVLPAATGPEGLEIARERRCDAVAVDLLLQGMSAADFVATMRVEGASRSAVCIVGAVGVPEVGVAGLVATDLVSRPVPADRLYAALERARVPKGRSRPALVVDGDLPSCKAAARTIEVLGYRSRPEPDGHAALRACAEETPSLVLLAPTILGLDPFTFLRHMRLVPGMARVPVLLSVPRQLDEVDLRALQDAAAVVAREGGWHADLFEDSACAARPEGHAEAAFATTPSPEPDPDGETPAS